jgi:beta-ureidopropionase / N-carbamoyl-L-amino-acid hydrolase
MRIDRARLLQRLDDLAQIGAITGTAGAARVALTDEDRDGRDLVVAWMRDLGLEVSVDAIGNIIGVTTAPSGTAPVMMGSHIDTVRTGGRYDGNYGVLAALEVIETVQAAGVALARPLAVGVFTDEEGARFPPDMLGSLVYVGGMALEEALDAHDAMGITVGDELDRIGYRGGAPCPGPVPHAFIELHIEQGPVLEAEGFRIGSVTGVQGISWTEITVNGQSNHAGTTPMHLRRDPGYVAARIATFVRQLTAEMGPPQVATVGRIDLLPDLINVVPASATLTVDLRNTDETLLCEAEHRLVEFVNAAAEEEGCTVNLRPVARFEPVVFDERIVALVEQTASHEGLPNRRMPSGAGHDAQMFARICPAGMIFVPSVKGLSHNPAEHTDAADLEAGANVLLDVVLALTEEKW